MEEKKINENEELKNVSENVTGDKVNASPESISSDKEFETEFGKVSIDSDVDEKETIIGSDEPDFVERKRWLFMGLPFTFTKYSIRKEVLTINKGFFKTIEDDCYMYKIVDVKLETSFIERIFRLGTVVCYSSDTSDRVIRLEHIRHSRTIKNYILSYSEKMRMKRRTLNTMSLNSSVDDVDLTDADL